MVDDILLRFSNASLEGGSEQAGSLLRTGVSEGKDVGIIPRDEVLVGSLAKASTGSRSISIVCMVCLMGCRRVMGGREEGSVEWIGRSRACEAGREGARELAHGCRANPARCDWHNRVLGGWDDVYRSLPATQLRHMSPINASISMGQSGSRGVLESHCSRDLP